MTWIFEKFIGDAAIYGICPKCNFRHIVSSSLEEYAPVAPYVYCPICGEHLHSGESEVEIVWNERRIEGIWEQEAGEKQE